jgi:hypothetical protein
VRVSECVCVCVGGGEGGGGSSSSFSSNTWCRAVLSSMTHLQKILWLRSNDLRVVVKHNHSGGVSVESAHVLNKRPVDRACNATQMGRCEQRIEQHLSQCLIVRLFVCLFAFDAHASQNDISLRPR